MTHHPAVFRSLRILYQIIKILNVTPKQNPEAMRPTTSAPCRAATRSLGRATWLYHARCSCLPRGRWRRRAARH